MGNKLQPSQLRVRMLAAMGLLAVGCPGAPAAQEPQAAAPGPADASAVDQSASAIAATAAIPVASAAPPPEEAKPLPPPIASPPTPPPAPTAVVAASAKPDAGAKTPPTQQPWSVAYPLAEGARGITQWCTREGSATCMRAQDVVAARGSQISKAVTQCPSARAISCPCHNGMMGCGHGVSSLGAGEECSEALMPYISNAQRKVGRANACCYEQEIYCGHPGEGRPLRDDNGHAISVADTVLRTDWAVAQFQEREKPDADWLRIAGLEHASIASFALLSLELMTLGAPAGLLRATHEAAIDEIEHARVAYALGGKGVGPGAMAMPARAPATLERVAVESLTDGCFGETVAALALRERADNESDPELSAALRRMADDETRHAELAFRIVAWACEEGGAAVLEAVQRASRELPRHTVTSDVVLPCIEAMAARYAPANVASAARSRISISP